MLILPQKSSITQQKSYKNDANHQDVKGKKFEMKTYTNYWMCVCVFVCISEYVSV